MILPDTHIWVWWVNDAHDLRPRQRELIEMLHRTGVDYNPKYLD